METQKKDDVVIKKKLVVPVIISIIAVLVIVAVVVVVFNISSSGKDRKLQEQLDLGEKYISELDYEQAIVAYEVAIEIDPMSVDAYLGLADAYEAQGDFEKAIEVLENAYFKTDSQLLFDEIECLKTKISEDVIQEEITEKEEVDNIDEYENGVPAKVVDGVYHNAYYKYDLLADEEMFLCQIVKRLENEEYEVALEELDIDKCVNIINTYASGEDYINIYLNEKKIHLKTDIYDVIKMVVLPIDAGTGYGLEKSIIDGDWSHIYICGECKEGVFWGSYEYTQVSFLSYNQSTSIHQHSGTTINGLLDGEMQFYNNNIEGETYGTMSHNMGLINYWNLKKTEDGLTEFYYYYLNGEEGNVILANSYEQLKEVLDNNRLTIMDDGVYGRFISSYEEIDGGMRYYEW